MIEKERKARKRKQGKGYPHDFIKDQIFLYLYENIEATGPDIRDYLEHKFGVSERNCIDDHLESLLKKEDLITKGAASRGRETRWKINPSLGAFKKIYEKILGTLPRYNIEKSQCNTIILLESRLVQEIIIPQLIEKIRSSNINQQIKKELYATLGISLNALTYATTSIGENNFSMWEYRNRLFRDLYDEEISNKEVLGCRMILDVVLHTKNDKAFKTGHRLEWGDIETDDLENSFQKRTISTGEIGNL